MNLPTVEEINPVPENLDGQNAVRNFLGKSLDEAEALFRESSITYQEDLMFMGPPAFRFYVLAAINYIPVTRADSKPVLVPSPDKPEITFIQRIKLVHVVSGIAPFISGQEHQRTLRKLASYK
jgi:hypothetical protein